MTEEDKLFDEVFKSSGGSLSAILYENTEVIDRMKEDFIGPIEFLKSVYPKLPHVNFGFIANQHLNATAAKYKDKYYVGVHIGTYYIIKDVFRKMMASRNILPDLGRSDAETEDQKLLNLTTTAEGLYFPMPPVHPLIEVNDQTRKDFAVYYANFALNFLILHEYAHIIRGHVGYFYSIGAKAAYSEINYSPTTFKDAGFAFFQTIEMDADSLATNRAFLNALHNMEIDLQKGSLSYPFFSDWPTYCFHWTFAIYIFFRIFGFNQYNIQKAKEKTHPPPVVRIALIAGNIATLFLERPEFKTNIEISKIVIDACLVAEQALMEVSFQQDQTYEFINQWRDPAIQEYLKEIWLNWKNVRPLLEPFTYGDLPPLPKV